MDSSLMRTVDGARVRCGRQEVLFAWQMIDLCEGILRSEEDARSAVPCRND